MPRLTPEQKLEKAKQDRDEAMARLRSAAGQIAAKSRKKETRRKIILGAIILERALTDPSLMKWLSGKIAKLPEKDRIAFDGWELPQPSKAEGQAASSSAIPTRT